MVIYFLICKPFYLSIVEVKRLCKNNKGKDAISMRLKYSLASRTELSMDFGKVKKINKLLYYSTNVEGISVEKHPHSQLKKRIDLVKQS